MDGFIGAILRDPGCRALCAGVWVRFAVAPAPGRGWRGGADGADGADGAVAPVAPTGASGQFRATCAEKTGRLLKRKERRFLISAQLARKPATGLAPPGAEEDSSTFNGGTEAVRVPRRPAGAMAVSGCVEIAWSSSRKAKRL